MLNIVNISAPHALQLALAQHQAGQCDQAEALCRQVLQLEPDNPVALHLLGQLAQRVGQLDAALELFTRAATLAPQNAQYHFSRANVLSSQSHLELAIAAFEQAIALQPDLADAHDRLSAALMCHGRITEAIAAARQALVCRPDMLEATERLLIAQHCLPEATPQSLFADHRRWARQFAEPLRQFIEPHGNSCDPERRLRIGYVSQDFRQQPVGLMMIPLLAGHDRRNFEVFCYAHIPGPDVITHQLAARADGWRYIAGLTDEQAAAQIRADGIDILVDLMMHSNNNRMLLFARKPAPVQATYLAYCSTTGLDTIDYRLTDPYLDPPGMNDAFYSEQSLRLPETYWYYKPVIEPPEVGPLPAARTGHVTFGCLNNFCKVTPPTLDAWATLLTALPQSRLILHAKEGYPRSHVRDVLGARGIAADRLSFMGYVPLHECFAMYNNIDIALDPFPWCGGLTTCDALWMGTPVITLAGQTGVSRGGFSLLSNLGLADLAAHTIEEYLAKATALATDLPRLAELRRTLRPRLLASPLMNAPRFITHLESAYRQMWRSWCNRPTV